MNLRILFLGDIVGKIGRRAVAEILPKLKEKYKIDLSIANAENLAHGQGVTLKTLIEVQEAGIDFFTSGNHVWKKKEAIDIFQKKEIPIIRPANYPPQVPGEGYRIIEIRTKKVAIINLMGRIFMKEDLDCPFRKIDEILSLTSNFQLPTSIVVDFHGEATSEKRAFGWYLDGRVSAVIGTHTHVPTADAQILPQGTAYVSDVGMIGAKESVIGVDKNIIIKKFLDQMPGAHEIPEKGPIVFQSILMEIDLKTGRGVRVERVDEEVKI
jgi:metallophosphoesterase (TIGR00282 family)